MASYRRGLFWRLPVDLFGPYLRMNIDLLNPESLLHKKTIQCPTLDRTHHAGSLLGNFCYGETSTRRRDSIQENILYCEQEETTESYPQEYLRTFLKVGTSYSLSLVRCNTGCPDYRVFSLLSSRTYVMQHYMASGMGEYLVLEYQQYTPAPPSLMVPFTLGLKSKASRLPKELSSRV
jgi:hypothetical protein